MFRGYAFEREHHLYLHFVYVRGVTCLQRMHSKYALQSLLFPMHALAYL